MIKDMPLVMLWIILGVLIVMFAANTISVFAGKGSDDSPLVLIVCISYVLDEMCRQKKS